MNSPLRLLAVPGYVLLIGLLCSVVVSTQVADVTAEKDEERFQNAVAQTHATIEGRIDTYVAMLETGAAMLASVDLDLSKAEFHAFAERLNLAVRYPGVQGIGYTIRIRRGMAPLVRTTMMTQGVRDFRLWPEDAVDETGERHAIIYLEPEDERNLAAIGYNMYSDPVRGRAMDRARDAGMPAASGAVELVQEIEGNSQAGFLIYVPVYEGGDPGSLEERRTRLAGFVYSPFRTDDMVHGIFSRVPIPRLHIELYDGAPDDGVLMHRSGAGPLAPGSARFTEARMLDIAGRSWTAVYADMPDFEFSASRHLPLLIMLAGAGITLLLAAGAWWQARTYATARRRTRELEIFNVLGAKMATEMDLERLIQAVTDAGVALSGAEFGAFFYNRTAPPDDVYMLYTVSGAPREAFEQFPHPRNTPIFAPTFEGKSTIRAADITRHPDYGKEAPYYGMPEGHLPVRSYLAAPVIGRGGHVVGGLFFGHHKAGKFDARSERVIDSLTAQAAIAVDNARLWQDMHGEMEHRKLLLDELNHRVKNTLATVQSMAAQTMRHADSLPAFRKAFESRLIAMSSTHNLLTKGDWKSASLRELLKAELAPFQQDGESRVTMRGPDVQLNPAQSTSLGMAFHELTTNAVKYGALSRHEGHVTVEWNVTQENGGNLLRIVWRERGGPEVAPPRRRGFGSRLIERGLVGQHGGRAELIFNPEGVTCEIEIPLAVISSDQAA